MTTMAAVADDDVHTRVQEVDLSKLIDFSMTFQPLQLTLHDMLQRLRALEDDNADKTAQLQRLGSELDALRQEQQQQSSSSRKPSEQARTRGDDADDDGGDDACGAAQEHAALWSELRRLNDLLGELHDAAEPRHTIDALYAARKHRESAALAGGGATAAAAARSLSLRPTSSSSTASTATTAAAAAAARAEQAARRRSTVRSALVASGEHVESDAQVPIGDIILSKAHEDLPVLDATLSPRETAVANAAAAAAAAQEEEEAAAAAAAGEHMQPPRHPPSSWSSAFQASSFGRPSRSISATDASSAAAQQQQRSSPTPRRDSGITSAAAAAHAPQYASRETSAQRSTASLPHITASASQPQLQLPATTHTATSAHDDRHRSVSGAAAGAGASSLPVSAFDSLRRDAADIAYLNRVVAEILDEMHTLQADVQQLRARDGDDGGVAAAAADEEDDGNNARRTSAAAARHGDDVTPQQKQPLAEKAAVVTALQRRLGALERALAEVDASSQLRDRDLHAAVDAVAAAQPRGDDDDDAAARLRALERAMAQLQGQLSSVLDAAAAARGDDDEEADEGDNNDEQAQRRDGEDGEDDAAARRARDGRRRSGSNAGGVTSVQFALLRAQVEQLQRQLQELAAERDARCAQQQAQAAATQAHDAEGAQQRQQHERLAAELRALSQRVTAAELTCAQLDDVKANKADVDGRLAARPSSRATRGDGDEQAEEEGAAAAATERDGGEDGAQALRRAADMAARLLAVEGRVQRVESDKADAVALQRLRDDLRNLRKLMEMQLPGGGGVGGGGAGGDGGADDAMATGGAASLERVVRELQQQLLAQSDSALQARGEASDALEQLRERLEQLDSRKADATLVANKAERDYVENALERLMREVEQVLNATNAGLIDTVDKSLNLLRDMMDGKATKHDIAQLQRVMAEDGASRGAADALTGFKGYRCLGCNRVVDTMRPRAQAAKLGNFVNRVAPNVLAVGNGAAASGGSIGGGGGGASQVARAQDAATRAAIQQQQQLQQQQQQRPSPPQPSSPTPPHASSNSSATTPEARMLLEQRPHDTPTAVRTKRGSEPLPPIESTATS